MNPPKISFRREERLSVLIVLLVIAVVLIILLVLVVSVIVLLIILVVLLILVIAVVVLIAHVFTSCHIGIVSQICGKLYIAQEKQEDK